MYLASGYWPGEIIPTHDHDDMCGLCHARPAAWGDWMCRHCRVEFEAQLRVEMGSEDEGLDDGVESMEKNGR